MPASGIDGAIRELYHEQERIQGVISALKSLFSGSGPGKRTRRGKRKRTRGKTLAGWPQADLYSHEKAVGSSACCQEVIF